MKSKRKPGYAADRHTKRYPKSKRADGGCRLPTPVTPELIEKFLEVVANNGGVVQDAANQLCISRTELYKTRRETKDQEFRDGKSFAVLWEEAVDQGVDVIEDEARRRGLDGTEEPIYYKGKIVGHVKKKSDFCLGIVLRAYRKQFREKHEISGPDGGPINTGVVVYLPDNKRDNKRCKKAD